MTDSHDKANLDKDSSEKTKQAEAKNWTPKKNKSNRR